MDEEELSFILESLASADASERRIMLIVLFELPTANDRVRAAVEALLDDRAICSAHPPAALTEVRWYAAHALAAEREAAGIHEPVRVPSAIGMLYTGDVVMLAEAAYGEQAPRSDWECFEKLRADGKLPTVDLILGCDQGRP